MDDKGEIIVDPMGNTALLEELQDKVAEEGRSSEFRVVRCSGDAFRNATEGQAADILANCNPTVKLPLNDNPR